MSKPLCAYVYSSNLKQLGENPFQNEYLKKVDYIYYSFAHIESDASLSFPVGFHDYLNELTSLHKNVILSINGARNLSNICVDENLRKKLVSNLIDCIKANQLSGIDIDWEVPGSCEKTVETDKSSLNQLVKDLKTLMPKGDLLTIAIEGKPLGDYKYDYAFLNTYIDYYNIMNYDANITDTASHLCPLYKVDNLSRNYSIDEAYKKLIQNGMDKEKMIISCAFYGKVYMLDEEINDGIIIGKKAHLTASEYPSGTAHYHYIKRFYNEQNGFEWFNDVKTGATFAYNPKTHIFVTFDDEISIKQKVAYAKQTDIGIMFWDYSGDYNNELLQAVVEKFK